MKLLNKFLLIMLLLAAGIASAQQPTYVGFEEDSLRIQLANNGTGIIRNVGCYKLCEDFDIVNITHGTRAYSSGVQVNILEAKSRAGKSAYVEFNPVTREVIAIYW